MLVRLVGIFLVSDLIVGFISIPVLALGRRVLEASVPGTIFSSYDAILVLVLSIFACSDSDWCFHAVTNMGTLNAWDCIEGDLTVVHGFPVAVLVSVDIDRVPGRVY